MNAATAARYFMTLSYDGAPYHGWQRQPGDISVQEVVENALSTLLRTPTPVTGAGRTDALVSARRMTAHFDTAQPIADCDDMVRRLNAIVGRPIAIYSLQRVRPDAHARFDARSRTYHYLAHTVKNPFIDRLSWFTRRPLDFDAMNKGAQFLIGRHDFTSFAKLHSDATTHICTVTEAAWHPVGDPAEGRFEFVITADRFLRNMVRAVVGTLVEVGRGKLPPEGVAEVMSRLNRCDAGTSMPGHALYLWDVTYPPEIYDVEPALNYAIFNGKNSVG
ncbi:MAG: tRNA pseudouridine(38-40) synthase TruA [Paramuribaculum sp.]|nr:tRNA pseudouridine(38-40) synthase TruA [Paramuribaculum sp.]